MDTFAIYLFSNIEVDFSYPHNCLSFTPAHSSSRDYKFSSHFEEEQTIFSFSFRFGGKDTLWIAT